jgi:hypothetical protein
MNLAHEMFKYDEILILHFRNSIAAMNIDTSLKATGQDQKLFKYDKVLIPKLELI